MPQLKKITAEKWASNMLHQAQHRQKYQQPIIVTEVSDEPAVCEFSVKKVDHRARRNPAVKNEWLSTVRHDGNDLNRTASSTKAEHTNAVWANGHGGTDFSIQVDCRQLVPVASLTTA